MKRKSVKRTSEWLIIRWMLILRPAIITATLGIAMFAIPEDEFDKTPIAIIVFGAYFLTLMYWFIHNFMGTSKPLLAIQISFDIFIITVIIVIFNYTTGGYDSSFIGFYFLSIMCASLFFKRYVTLLFVLQSIILFLLSVYIVGQFLDPFLITDEMKNSVMFQSFMYSALMIAVGFFSSYYAERIIRKDTALTSALQLLRRARLDTSDILQSMTNGLITLDNSGLIMYMNGAAKSILQIDDSFVEGKDYRSVLRKRSPELVKVLEKGIHEKNLSSEIAIEICGRDGVSIPIGLSMVTLYDVDGSRSGVIVNFKDLTEKNKLLEMIRQSDRMAAIGELSASIAHELKNPLASICSAIEILADSIVSSDTNTSKLLDIIEKESERLERISSEFLQFTRENSPNTKPVNLKTLIEDVLVLLENDPRNTENIVIRNQIDESVVVMFDIDHLKQILLNLLINSLDALEGKGEIEIALEKSGHPENRYVRMVIRDNGPGFHEDALGKMFEPFYSTKKSGTGLGLAIVRKMTVANNGRILAQNLMDGGAEVELDIPVEGAE